MPEGESLESLEGKQKRLLHFHNLEPSKWNSDEILALMADTYYLQRLDINNNAKIVEIKLRWPFLIQVNCMNSHFKLLTGIDAIKSLKNFLASESKQIIKYFTSMGNAVPACLKLERELNNQASASKVEVVVLIFMLAVSLKEDIGDMFHKIEEDADENNLSDDVPTTPCLIFKSQSAFASSKFFLAVDKVIFGTTSDPISAVAMVFSAYYIFNIKYSTGTPATLEFIQRIIMGINPEKGSKLPKKKGNRQWSMSPPVLSLITAFNSFKDLFL